MIKRTQGNTQRVIVPLFSVTLHEDGTKDIEQYTPQADDVVIATLVGERQYRYTCEAVDASAVFTMQGVEVAGVYALQMLIVKSDGTRMRYFTKEAIELTCETIDDLEQGAEFTASGITLDASWFLFAKGDTGNGIEYIEKTSTEGLVDTYTIYYTNGTTTTYQVTNGKDGETPDVSKFVQLNEAGVVSQVNAPMQRFHTIMVDEYDQRVAGLNYVVEKQEFEVWGYKQGVRPPRLQLLGTDVPNQNVLYFDEYGIPYHYDGTGLIQMPWPASDEILHGDNTVEVAIDNLEENKQDKLVAGSNITIEGNVISSSGGGEKEIHVGTDEPTEGEVLWIDPNEQIIEQTTGQATDKVMSQDATTKAIATKQDKLTAGENITIENNVISANGALRTLFVSAGAVYNSTTGYYELNGLTDITEEEMKLIYNSSIYLPNTSYPVQGYGGGSALITRFLTMRTTMPMVTGNALVYYPTFQNNGRIEVIGFVLPAYRANSALNKCRLPTSSSYLFYQCKKLVTIIDVLVATSATNFNGTFVGCAALQDIKLHALKVSVSFNASPNLSKESILYMIENEVATSAITITLHATAYAMAQADSEIQTALSNHPYVTLASA